MEGGEDVSKILGDLSNSLPAADFEIGNSDEVRCCVPHAYMETLRVLVRILFLFELTPNLH